MSIGNINSSGDKKNNWPWQYKMLKGLDKIAAAIVSDGKDYESDLISIKCGANPAIIRLEVRIFDTTTGDFTNIELYPPGSLVEDTTDYSACTKTYLESGDATEATLELCRQLLATIDADTGDIATNTADISTDTGNIETNTDTLRNSSNAASMLRPSTVAVVGTNDSIAALVKSISFYNASSLDAQIEAGASGNVVLKAGETVNFDAGGNGNKFPANHFKYDPDPATNAGDLLILYVA